MATINVPADFLSIQDAVAAASAGDTILVGPGTYTENVVIDKPLTLLSTGGRDATTILGDGAGGELGTIQVLPGVDDVTIGGPGQGFTVVGIDGNGAIEKAAIYLQGNHDGILIQGNDVVANGDAGLLSEFGAAVTHTTIDGNVFSGQTFAGAQPGGVGFATQFNVGNNVPRQLVTMGNGGGGPYVSANIVFTNNEITGTAGGISSDDGTSEQGNTLVTIDAANATISNNEFTGFTNRFATAVRARGPNTEVSDNTFDASASGSHNTLGIFIDNKGSPASYDGNTFVATDGAETLPAELTPGGDDTFVPGGGDDDIQGGGGFDTAVFSGNLADYAIVDTGGGVVVVTDLRPGSPDGSNTLRQFERFEFADGVVLATGPAIDLDLNDSSGAAGNDFQGSFVEGGGPLLLNNGDIRITDPDGTTVQGAFVELTNPLDGAAESLAINAALATVLGIAAVVSGDGHSITLTGAASHAAYQAVLGTVTYDNSSVDPDATDRRITFQVSDGLSDSPVANATVAIMAVNQAPTLDLDQDDSTAAGTGAAHLFQAGGAPVAVTDGDVAIGDTDGTALASATIALTDAPDGAAETLAIDMILAGNLGLAVAFGPDDQSITITGVADHVFYEVLLATVTYDNGATLPTAGDRTIEIVVNDGSDDSAVATGVVTVVGNPLPADDAVVVTEDSVANDLTAALLANDNDADGDPLTITGASGSASGSVSVAPDGTLTYTPNGDFAGTDSFVYTVSDGNGGLATASATVTVTNENDPPVLSDPGGVEFAFGFETGALVDGGGFGWFDFGGGPAVVPSGTGGVPSDEGGFHMTLGTSAGAQEGAFTRFGGYMATFPPDGFTTEVSIHLDLAGIAGSDRGFDYSVAINNQAGNHHRDFVFTVKEEGGVYQVGASNNAATGGVPNEPPTNGGPIQSITASGWYTFRHSFVDDGGVLRVDMQVLDAGGAVVGSWSLSNGADLIASVVGGNRYGWIMNNQIPDLPVDGTVKLGPAGAPPVFFEDQPVGVVVNDDFVITDIDDTQMAGATVAIANFVAGEDVLQFANMPGISGSFDAGTGILTLSGTASVAAYEAALSSVRYFNANTGDPDTTPRLIEFTVSDGDAVSAPVVIEVAVQPVADDPVAANDNLSVAEDSGPNDLTSLILANDNDPDGDGLTVIGATGAANGTIDVAPDGTVTYDPDANYVGTDAFVYTVTDGNGGATATATATVTVTPANDAPALDLDFDDSTAPGTGSAATYTEGGSPVLLNDGDIRITDLDGGTITSATVVLDNPLDGAAEAISISISLAGFLGLTATIAAGGHSITVTGPGTLAVYQAVLGTVTYENASATPDITPRTVSFTVNDGSGDSLPATATVTIQPLNSPIFVDLDLDDSSAPGIDSASTFVENGPPVPAMGADIKTFDMDGTTVASVTIVLANPLDGAAERLIISDALATNYGLSLFYGPDNHSITISGVAPANIYEVLLTTIHYRNTSDSPDPAVREIQITPHDGISPGLTSTAFVTIVGQADDPSASDDMLVVAEDAVSVDVTAALLANDGDPDGDTLTVIGASGAAHGSVSIAPDVTVTFDPAPDFHGTDSFVYTVTDGNGGATASAAVTVTVTSAADSPFAVDDVATLAEDGGPTDLTELVLANDGDVDGDGLTVVGADGALHGTVDVTGGALTYAPEGDFAGTDSFVYTITDGNGGGTATAMATVTVTGVNDPPVLTGGPVFGENFDDGTLNDGSTGFFDFGVGTFVVPSGTDGVSSLTGGFHATVGASTPGDQGGAFTRWGGFESVFPTGGYTTRMAIYLDVGAHAGNDVGFTYSNALNRPDGTYRTEFYFNVGTTGDPGDGFVVGASQRANDGMAGVPAVPGPDFGPTVNVTASGWYVFMFQATESGPGIRLDFTLLDQGGNVVGTWVSDRPDLVRGVEVGGNRYGWVLANEIPDLPVDDIVKGEVAAPSTVTYSEDGPPVAVDGAITVADVDDTNLEGATVAFVGGYVMGEDVLNFAGLGNISGSFDAAAGVLTLTGTDSLANYQAALRAVTYANLAGDDPTGGTRTVRFLATDGEDESNAILAEVEVVPVNDAPLFDLDADDSSGAADPDFQTVAVAGGGAVALNDGDILLTDADDTALDGATILLVAAPDGANEGLTVDAALAAGFGVTVAGNGTGAITLTGSASPEAYRLIFASAAYENQSGGAATPGQREVVFTTDDGDDPASASAFVTVAVPPVLDLDFDDSTAAGSDSAVTFTECGGAVLLNDGDIRIADLDGTTLQGASVVLTNPLDGAAEVLTINVALATVFGITVVLAPDGHSIALTGAALHAAYQAVLGTVRYANGSIDPDTTDRAVTFSVNDGVTNSNVATATVVIDPVNQAPAIDLDADDSTAPGLGASATFVAHHGPVGILGPDIAISDVDGTVIASATVTLANPADGAAEALSIDTVLAGNLGLTVVFGPDAQSITLGGVASHLTYEIVLATVRYVNAAASPTTGDRLVEVTVNDGFDDSAVAVSTVTVVPDPAAADDIVAVAEDSGANDLTAALLGNDADADGDSLTVIAASGAGNGTVGVGPDGVVTYTPDGDFHGTDGFTYTITDGNGGTSSASVTVTVTPVADDPIAAADTAVVVEDSGANDLTAILLANDIDADGDSLTVVGASGAASGALGVATDGTVTYTPDADYFGTDAFVYTVTDGNGGATATASVAVTVTPVADDPAAADDMLVVAEDSGANDVTAALFANDGDVDGDSLTIVAAGGAGNGTVVVAPDGTVTFTPDPDYFGSDSFTYTITDGNGGATASATATITVTPVNDPPSLDLDFDDSTAAGADTAVAFAEGGPAVLLNDGDIRIADADGTTIQSAAVVLTNPLDGAAEILTVDAVLAASFGITAVVAPDGHSIALTGSASHGAYQAVLGTVRYSNGSVAPSTTPREIEMTVNDGAADSNVATAVVAILADDQAPVLDLDGDDSSGAADPNVAAAFVEDGGVVVLTNGDVVLTDVDSTGLTRLTVQLLNPLDGAAEGIAIDTVLAASFGLAVVATATAIEVTGAAPIAAYRALIESVTYENASETPDETARTIRFQVESGAGNASNPAFATVSVAGANDDPVADDDAIVVVEDSGANNVTGQLLAGDTDPDGDSLTVIGASGAASGTVTVLDDGTVLYTPDDDFAGPDGFAYTVTDGNGGATASAFVTVTVTPVADDPVAANDTVSVIEDTVGNDLTAAILANDVDGDGDTLTIVGASSAGNGALTLGVGGTVTYTPDADFFGTDGFTYTVTDGNGGATASAAVTIDVTGTADDPTAADDTVAVTEDSGANDLTAALLANDGDVDGDALTVIAAGGAANGTIEVAPDGTLTYTPGDGQVGTDGFTYTITDGNGGATASASVTVTVTSVNDDPVAADDGLTVAEDSVGNDLTAGLLGNDLDADGDNLTVVAASGAGHGAVMVAIDGTVTYSPDINHFGTDGFTYTITDGNGGTTASATATITVTPLADDPVAAEDAVTVAEDSVPVDLTADLLSNDGDVDGDVLTIVGASGAGAGTVAVAPDGTLTYQPDADTSGTDGFVYTVTDGNGGATATAAVTVTITPDADPPVAVADSVTIAEDSGATDLTALLIANDGDADGDGLTIVGASGAVNGTVAVAPDGTVAYMPDADYFGTDGFVYTVTDGNGGGTSTAAVTVTVTPVADDPVADDDMVSVAEDGGATDLTAILLANDADADGDGLTVVGASGAGNGTVGVAPDGTVTFTPHAGFTGTDSFVYTVTDGNGGATASATVTVTVTPVADDPVAATDAAVALEDSGANDLTAALLANDGDPDGDPLTVVGASGAANGTVAVAPDGTVTYTPDADFHGNDDFVYTITDGNGGATATASVAVTVTPVADDPTAADDAIVVSEDSGANDLTAALLANDGDVDGDSLTVVAASGAANGSVVVAPDGTVTYTPNADFAGTDTFTYTITDGNGGATASATAMIAVTAANDPPALDLDLNDSTAAGSAFAASFTEGGPPALLNDGDIRITDADSAMMQSATVVLTNPLDGAAEALSINAVLAASFGITAVVAPDGHSIALAGAATRTQYQAVLGTVRYGNNSIDPDTTPRTVEFTVNDGTSNSNVAVATIGIVAVNQSPTLDLDADNSTGAADPGSAVQFFEDGPAVVLTDGDIVIADVDGPGIESATVTIADPQDAGEVLTIDTILAGNLGVTVVVTGGGTGLQLTATGAITNLEWQQLLQTVAYDNGAGEPTGTSRSVAFTVNDGTSDSNVAIAHVAIVGVNDDPAAADDAIVVTEDAGPVDVTATLLGNDSDVDGDTLTVVAAGGAGNGTLNVAPDGTVIFTPDADFHGTDAFTYTITDGNGGATASATVAVAVTPVADDPVPADDAVTVAEDSGANDLTATLLGNDTDGDGDMLTIVAASGAGNGTLNVSPDGTVIFTPDADFSGTDGFTYTVTDGNGGATASATVTVTVTPANDDPAAAGDTITVAEDSGATDVTALLLANDGDPDGDPLTVVSAGGAANGTVAVAPDGTVTFTPNADVFGTDTFTYTITDGNGGATASASVTVSVTSVADDPAAAADAISVAEDSGANDMTAALLANDTDADGDALTVVGASGAANGTVAVAPDGMVTFTPDADHAGTDAFTYTITDGNGGATASATAVVTVTATADDPAAADDAIVVAEDSGASDLTAALLADDGDGDGDALTIVGASGAGSGTLLVAPDGTLTYAPDAEFSGTDSFVYTITDGNGGATASATAIVTVTAAADAPVAGADAIAVAEDSGATDVTATLLANDTDADGDSLTVVGASGIASGTVDVAPDGTVTFAPDADFSGTDAFTYTVTDGNGGGTASATVTVSVTPAADDPTAADDLVAVGEDTVGNDLTAALLANDADADGDALTVVGASGAANGTLAVAPDGTVTYSPDAGHAGTDGFVYTITDGNGGATATASVTIDVTDVNDDPEAVDDSLSVAEDSGASDLTAALLANDIDADVADGLTVIGASGAAHGTVLVAPDGTVTYDPAGDFNGTDSFTYTITDGNGGATSSATATITVTPVADDPFALADSAAVEEDSVDNDLTALVLANDGDVDGDALTVVGAGGAGNGTVTVQPDGSLLYTPTGGYVGTDGFTYTVTDGNGGATATATVTVAVGPVNDDPTAADDAATVAEDAGATDLTALLLANDGDIDGDALTIVGAVGASNGTVSVAPDGTLTYAPDADFAGTDSFVYTISDGNGGATASATVAVTVTPAADDPVAVDDGPLQVTENVPSTLTVALLANDFDPDGDALTIVGASGALHGSVGFDGSDQLVYTPAPDYLGTDSFTYTITDGNGGATTTATATISVVMGIELAIGWEVFGSALVQEGQAATYTVQYSGESVPPGQSVSVEIGVDLPGGVNGADAADFQLAFYDAVQAAIDDLGPGSGISLVANRLVFQSFAPPSFDFEIDIAADGSTEGLEVYTVVIGNPSAGEIVEFQDLQATTILDTSQAPAALFAPGTFDVARDAAATMSGTDGSDALAGTGAADVIDAGDGNDTILAVGSGDIVRAGGGDDHISVDGTGFRAILGGEGVDVVHILGGAVDLNLAADGDGRLGGIEVLDITGSGDNSVELSYADLLEVADPLGSLTVVGDAGDRVAADLSGAGFVDEGVQDGFHVYSNGTERLLVSEEITDQSVII